MSQSLCRIIVHILFSTKNRVSFLKDETVRRSLEAYTAGILKNLGSPAIIIRSVEDHIHILCLLSKTITVAKLIEEVKTGTSKWLKPQRPNLREFYWQTGYGAFSVSDGEVETVTRYIQNQDEHHRTQTWQDEVRELFKKHGLEIDERYMWD